MRSPLVVIVATIVTSTLAFSSLSLAASDEELGRLGDKMRDAFRCSTYAGMSDDFKEQKRLFQIGLKAARDFVKGIKSSKPPVMGAWKEHLGEASTDFMVGTMYQSESDKADDEIRKYRDEQQRERLLDPDAAKTQAKLRHRDSNCSLIQ
jgi:hypothetical protein